MLWKKKLLQINELKPGMVLAKDIIFEDRVLLAKDIAITESALTQLKRNYIIDSVEVYLEGSYDNELLTLKIKSVEEIENTFNEFSSNLEDIFDRISNLKVHEIDEIRTFSKKIQEEFNSTGLVIRNILFHGNVKNNVYKHSVNVAAISFILGKWLGLDEREINLLTYSAILHDFGKIKLDKNILNKNTRLTSEEYKIFKTHPVIGYRFVKEISYLDNSVACGILMHHERINGSGYPLGIKEGKIHKFAKIIAIADLFDRVSSDTYSKKINGPFEALKVIQDESLEKFDHAYCNMFLNHVINYFIGENVMLNNQRSCKVIQVNINDLTRPLLLGDNGFLDLKKEKNLYVTKLII
ncbi:HD-GYP domain-containing protein [Clostridium sp. WILCCON 0269]|uniref:HD-GYP domain-containing protein n=1 Tax=Candidatus Clostridium eludens TaxID=3381663 RepID=A0ABW8SKP9_9CLOT